MFSALLMIYMSCYYPIVLNWDHLSLHHMREGLLDAAAPAPTSTNSILAITPIVKR